jgi:hypothetical protein
MFGFCQLCDTPEIEVMFAKGVEACYSCLTLTDTDTEELEEEEL